MKLIFALSTAAYLKAGPMNLYLLRHGKAARPDADQPRSLTVRGKAEVALIAGHFKKQHLQITHLWHSPKTRAVQTMEIFLKIAGGPGVRVEEKKGLKPEGDAREIFEEINLHREGSLMLVTHLPIIGDIAGLLTADSARVEIAFPTAGLAAFEKTGENWKWLWSLDPSKLKG
jgi:phosphohistidine phosphatase